MVLAISQRMQCFLAYLPVAPCKLHQALLIWRGEGDWIVQHFVDCFEVSDDLDLHLRWPVGLIFLLLIGFIEFIHVCLALLRNDEREQRIDVIVAIVMGKSTLQY